MIVVPPLGAVQICSEGIGSTVMFQRRPGASTSLPSLGRAATAAIEGRADEADDIDRGLKRQKHWREQVRSPLALLNTECRRRQQVLSIARLGTGRNKGNGRMRCPLPGRFMHVGRPTEAVGAQQGENNRNG